MPTVAIPTERAPALRYGVAVAASFIGLLVRLALNPLLEDAAPLLLFILPVVFSAWYGGMGPGLLCCGLCALLGDYFLLPPIGSLFGYARDDLVRMISLLLGGVGSSLLFDLQHGTLRRAAATAEALRASEARLRATMEELRRSQAHLAGIIGTAMDAIITVDSAQRIVIFNRAAEQLFLYRADEVLGRPLDILIPVELRDAHRHHVGAFGETGVSRRSMRSPGLLRALRRDGHEFPIEATIAQFDVEGERFFTVILRDVSERLRAEEERRALDRKLREAQRLESLGVLAGGVAHDFNNLLGGILGNAELALEEIPPGSPGHSELQQIQRITRRAAELTQQMLAYSGRGRFVVTRIDLAKLVDEMRPLLEASVSTTTTLTCEVEPGDHLIDGDPTQIRQVIMNLVINAGEALHDRPGAITITVAGRSACPPDAVHVAPDMPPGPCVLLSVTDTGSGISPEHLGRIFEPFFTTKFTGRGLGLAAVLGIVRSHRGALTVESAPGRGSTFSVYFPVAERHVAPAATTRDYRTSAAPGTDADELQLR